MSGHIGNVLGSDTDDYDGGLRPPSHSRAECEVIRRPDGSNVPWIGLFAIVGVLVTALASVALGFVEPDPRAVPPGPAVNVAPR